MANSMTKKSSIKKNMAYQLVYRALTLITPLVTAPYLARVLGADLQGLYSFSLSILSYFTMLAYLGIDNYGTRSIAKELSQSDENLSDIFWEIYTVQMITSLISIALFIFFFFTSVFQNKELYIIQSLCLISALFDINWFFSGIEQFRLLVTRNSIIKVLTVISIFAFVKGKEDLNMYAFIMVLSRVISAFVMWPFLFKVIKLKRPSFHHFFIHLKANISLFIPVIAVTVYHTMDKTMLGILSDYQNVGFYFNADKVISMPLGMITGIGLVMLPRMSNVLEKEGLNQGQQLIEKSIELNMFLSCAMSLGIMAVAKEFVPLFFGSEFYPCINLIGVFAPVLIIKTMSSLLQIQFLIPSNNEKIYVLATFIGAGVNMLLNLALIPSHGALGAALGTLGAEIAVLIIEIIKVNKIIHFTRALRKNLFYFIPSAIMYVGVRLIATSLRSSKITCLFFEIVFGAFLYFIVSIPFWAKMNTSIFNPYIIKTLKKLR